MFFRLHAARKLGAIYAGGALGAIARVGLARTLPHGPDSWPWSTFIVNVGGALAIGYLYGSFRDHRPEQLQHPFLATGICSTLTTFSTLQLELFAMVDTGYLQLAAAYCAATVLAGYLAVVTGLAIEQRRAGVLES
jgi:fluoride exporter